MKKIFNIFLSVIIIATVLSCSNRKITRVDAKEQIDLSGRWNSTDAQQVSKAMIDQALGERWVENFQRSHNGDKPSVIVGFVQNNTSEHIDAEIFLKDLEKAFINSGRVRLIAGGSKREEIRGERAEQQKFSSQATMKRWGQEIGADYMLQGTLSSITDSYKKEKVIYYQVDLQLTDIETNEIVWIGDKKIKKYIVN